MQRLKSLLIWFWRIASRPSAHLSLGFLALGGFVCGVLFWGAFNTALEVTNTEKFCTSCHEMHNNVFQELQHHRLELAKHEWARLKANDSLECRNCHSSVAMDFTKQTRRAAEIHGKFLVTGDKTCIDCHKGIAHELPDMTGIEPGWRAPPEMRDRQTFRDNPRDELMRYLAATGSER